MAVRTAPPRGTKVPEIRKGDTVVVLAGKDAGKRGKVERVVRRQAAPSVGTQRLPARLVGRWRAASSSRASTSPSATPSRASRPARPTACPKIQQGGILEIAQPIPVSKVMLVCPNCGKPTRIAHATLDTGRRVRVCRHCGEQLEVKS